MTIGQLKEIAESNACFARDEIECGNNGAYFSYLQNVYDTVAEAGGHQIDCATAADIYRSLMA